MRHTIQLAAADSNPGRFNGRPLMRAMRGSLITESRDVTHWSENKERERVVLIGVDLVKS
jgi:hypothetical protein